jgi:hypothetical protein
MDTKRYDDTCISLEKRIDKLFLISDEIKKNKGMCKKFALECYTVIPKFNNNIAMAYYTKEPSIAEYHTSLEEISKGIWALIVAAIAAALAMIYKFFNWLFDSSNSSSSSYSKPTAKSLTEIVDNTESIGNNINALNDEVKRHITISDPVNGTATTENFSHYKVSDIDDIVGRYIESKGSNSEIAKVLREEDPIFHDVMNQGEYTRKIKATSGFVVPLPKLIDGAVSKYTTLVKEVDGRLKKLHVEGIEHVELDFTHSRLPINSTGIDIGSVVTEIYVVRDKVLATKPLTNRISFVKLNELFLHSLKNIDIVGIIIKIEDTERHLEGLLGKLTKAGEDVSKMATATNAEDPTAIVYAKGLRDIFNIIRADVVDCFKFFKELLRYADTIHKVDATIRNVQRAALKIIEAELKKYGDLPKSVVEIYKHLDKEVIFR